MSYWIGTSGYSYPEWKGRFYPEKLPAAKMLGFYAERFSTVEINATFYRLPSVKMLAGWAAQTPADFAFTLKAPRRITHDSRLQRAEEVLHAFLDAAATLGPKLGVFLFQLPPSFKKDVGVLTAFLDLLPSGTRAAFEFRHPSWLADEVYAALRQRNLALCIADSERFRTPAIATADYGYFRLRDEGYQDEDLSRWAATIAGLAAKWTDTFVYFKHEEQGLGPDFADRLRKKLTFSCSPSQTPGSSAPPSTRHPRPAGS